MNIRNKIIFILIVGLSISYPTYAYAAIDSPAVPSEDGKSIAQLNGYSDDDWNKLTDDKLEYDEIYDRIHTFNPTIISAWNMLSSSIDSMKDSIDNIKSMKKNMTDLKDKATSDGNVIDIINYTMQEIILDKSADAMSKALKTLERPASSTNEKIRQGEAQMVSGAKSLMIGYKSVESQKELLAELVNLYEESYDAMQASMLVGYATQMDINQAYVNLASARSNLSSLEATQIQLRKSLLIICGYDSNDDITIGDIPHIEESSIDALNPDTDITEATGNNYILIDHRHETYKMSLGTKEAYDVKESELEQNLKTNINILYTDILANKKAYDAALSGYESAKISKIAADKQYELGMLSKAQYIGSCITYVQKKASYEVADMTLTNSYNLYNDAISGNCSVE